MGKLLKEEGDYKGKKNVKLDCDEKAGKLSFLRVIDETGFLF